MMIAGDTGIALAQISSERIVAIDISALTWLI